LLETERQGSEMALPFFCVPKRRVVILDHLFLNHFMLTLGIDVAWNGAGKIRMN
jgi:hypothetical protein